jgi:hypothetical protein
MPPAGFEPAVPASKRPQSLALDSSATQIDLLHIIRVNKETRMKFVSHIHWLQEMINTAQLLSEDLKSRDHLRETGVS